MVIDDGGSAALEHVVISSVDDAGIVLRGSARLSGTDVSIRDVALAGLPSDSGTGIRLEGAGELDLDRVAVRESTGGIWVGTFGSSGSMGALRDVVISSTTNAGLICVGCELTVERIVIENANGAAMLAQNGRMTLTDAVIRDVGPDPTFGAIGRAVFAEGTNLNATRVWIERATEQAVTVGNGTGELLLQDAVITETRSTSGDLRYGRALAVDRSARAHLERALITDNRDVAVVGFGSGTQIELVDTRVLSTRERECATTNCPDAPAGIGVGAYMGAQLRAERFAIRDAALCGLQLATDGRVDLDMGEVSGCPVGACVQVDGYDLTRLSATVDYYDNGANLQATTLPVPTPGTSGL